MLAIEVEQLLRESPELRELPKDVLRSAAVNRLKAKCGNVPRLESTHRTVQLLKSNGVNEVVEVSEVAQGNGSFAAVPEAATRAPEPAPLLPDVELPVAQYVREAADYIVTSIMQKLIPEHQCIFQFVRLLKAHPRLSEKTANKVWEMVGKSPVDPSGWIGEGEDDGEAAFYDAWDSARLPAGIPPLTEAHRRAIAIPLELIPGTEESRPPGYTRFVSLAGWLCVVVASKRIKLPCEAVADVLGVTAMTVSRYRNFAERDGYLRLVKKPRFQPSGQGEATTFLFRVEFWDILLKSLPEK